MTYNLSHDDNACGSVWSKLATLLIVIGVETLLSDGGEEGVKGTRSICLVPILSAPFAREP